MVRPLLIGLVVLIAGTAGAEELETSLRQLAVFESEHGRGFQLLYDVATATPTDVQIRTLEQTGQRVTLVGWSRNNEQIAVLLSRLESSAYADQLYLTKINAREIEGIPVKEFTATFRALLPNDPPPGLDAVLTEIEPRVARLEEVIATYPMLDGGAELRESWRPVQDLAKEVGLAVTKLMPGHPVRVGHWDEHPTAIGLTGGTTELLLFFGRLLEADRVYVWRDLRVTVSTRDDGSETVEVVGDMIQRSPIPVAEQPGPPGAAHTGASPAAYGAPDPAAVMQLADPFDSFVAADITARLSVPALRRYDVDDFEVLTLDCVAGVAILRDPDGGEHEVRVGTTVGRNFGVVGSFGCARVTVTEEYRTVDGEVITNDRGILLKSKVEAEDPDRRSR